MNKSITTLLILALFLVPIVIAEEDFSAATSSLISLEKCTSSTNVIKITNTGDQTNNYILSGLGDAKDWVSYPGIFSLAPGRSTNVETLVDVPCVIKSGYYQLITSISTTTGLYKEIVQDLTVEDTQNIVLSASAVESVIKPCSRAEYLFTIKNPSSFAESYSFSVNDPDASLSEEQITLASGESKEVTLSIEPADCKRTGEYDILFSASTEKTQLVAELDLFLEISDYGIVDIASEVNKIRTDYNKNAVDLEIKNIGSEDVSYILDVSGADWVSISPRMLTIEGGKTETVTLTLEPAAEVRADKYSIKLIAEVEETGAEYSKEITVKLNRPGIINNLFDKYLPLTVLIIIALIVFGIIVIYSIQHMSTEEYQKRKLKAFKEKEKRKAQKIREKERKRKEKERLKKERQREKEKIRAEKARRKEAKLKKKETDKERKAKKREQARKKREKQERKIAQKHKKELKKEFLLIAKKDVIEGKKQRRILAKILFIIILLVIIAGVVVFIKPIVSNIQYVVLGIIVLVLLFILSRIKRNKTVKTKWKGLSLVEETKLFDVNWKRGVQQVKLLLKKPVTKLRAKIKKGRGRNERYICIDEKIYQYFRLSSNAEEEIKSVETVFRVKKKWLARKNIDSADISLYHLENGEWTELTTRKLKSDDKYAYYSAKTKTIGQFAIIGVESTKKKKKEPVSKGKGVLAIIGIVIIAILLFLLLKPAPDITTGGIPTQTWVQGEQHSVNLNTYFADPDGDPLDFDVKNSVENIDIWFKDGIAYLTPDAEFTGDRTVVFTATDDKGGDAESNPVKLIVRNRNADAVLNIVKYAVGIIIILLAIFLLVKIIFMVRENLKD